MDFAIIAAGGKQYLVSAGNQLHLDYVPAAVGQTVRFPVLLRWHANGDLKIGRPTLEQPAEGTVTAQGRSDKVTVIKFKRKVRYRRKVGHRYPISTVQISRLPG